MNIEKKYKNEVSKLAKNINRHLKTIYSLQLTCEKRLKQMQIDNKFKKALEQKSPALYKEIVQEIMKDNV